ncbi:MAG: hypothetical protein L0H53_08245, partial [Candidatus Nitrosocosmicus sp.]|nr:hypothetical protein [Candidatus Nitrosocosmicus sp.]MDN5868637.1 hypothetical protein [Candidatus Nitrosocosmicus sp.]
NDGTISRLNEYTNAGAISRLSVIPYRFNKVITAIRDGDGDLRFINWEIDTQGHIARLKSSDQKAGQIGLIEMSKLSDNRFITTLQDGDEDLLIISWEMLIS